MPRCSLELSHRNTYNIPLLDSRKIITTKKGSSVVVGREKTPFVCQISHFSFLRVITISSKRRKLVRTLIKVFYRVKWSIPVKHFWYSKSIMLHMKIFVKHGSLFHNDHCLPSLPANMELTRACSCHCHHKAVNDTHKYCEF